MVRFRDRQVDVVISPRGIGRIVPARSPAFDQDRLYSVPAEKVECPCGIAFQPPRVQTFPFFDVGGRRLDIRVVWHKSERNSRPLPNCSLYYIEESRSYLLFTQSIPGIARAWRAWGRSAILKPAIAGLICQCALWGYK